MDAPHSLLKSMPPFIWVDRFFKVSSDKFLVGLGRIIEGQGRPNAIARAVALFLCIKTIHTN